ncbi:hypothetical protein Cdeb_02754 [Caldibacillus debilis GB1]|uniref:Uncharacterized protein n=1 Tax=Caldibacillus debilis GB1 TaxID=1339248 RepID=A0A420VII2_9BACI|nr:hypothetical protein Cdeb_02754 [Caldibacillus debilis GB1]
MPGSAKEGNGFAGKFSWTGYSGTFPGYPDLFRFGAREGEPAGAVSRSSSAARPDAGTVRRVRPSPPEEQRENRASSAGTAFPSRGATGKPDLHRFRRLGEGAAKFSWSDWFRDRTFPFSGEPSGPLGAGERRGAAGWVPSGKIRRSHPILVPAKISAFPGGFRFAKLPRLKPTPGLPPSSLSRSRFPGACALCENAFDLPISKGFMYDIARILSKSQPFLFR